MARAAEHTIREDLGRGLNLRQLLVAAYLFLLVGWPLWRVVQETFLSGENYLVSALQDPTIQHALQVTLAAAAWAVALNTVFGITLGILLVRYEFPGRRLLSSLLDLPISVSPVVVGLALLLAYGLSTGCSAVRWPRPECG